MNKRLQSVGRILEAQRQLYRAAEWQLARLKRQEADLEAEQLSLIAALNDDQALQGLFIEATANRLRAVAKRIEAARQARERQEAELAEQAVRVKRAERLADSVELEHRRAEERRELAQIVEQAVGRSRASLR
jgi:hypothetical protein